MSDALDTLRHRLQDLSARTAETPIFNPVYQLSLDLSRQLEGGELDLDAVEALVAELECEGLRSRAVRLRRLVGPVNAEENAARFAALDDDQGFAAFTARWQRPVMHAVFTAHPTFVMTPAQADAVARAAASDTPVDATCVVAEVDHKITLDFEHQEATAAIARAADARDRLTAILLQQARDRWPDRWLDFTPMPFRFATWVGYDMDGRTDISWATSVAYRLREKADRLGQYAAQLEVIDPQHDLVTVFQRGSAEARARSEHFRRDLADPDALSAAANRLTADNPDKFTTLAPMVARLEDEARACAEAQPDKALALKVLIGALRADGLGMGWIHFRVNASQLRNAIRRTLDPEGTLDLDSKSALVRLRELITSAKTLRSNFAALAIETSTAVRQFLAMAQILRHVDADAPIRMLIAECEQPQTVLAALYFARLFGIDDRVDVSPLFETETALEHGGRFLDALLAEPEYQTYVRKRGRVAIQTGFSDAGRFVGQIPAALAIERLHGRLAAAMQANGLSGVSALVFNTHGESMGRGAHPAGLSDRLTWPLSDWARERFARAGIVLEPEVSFQGGDGYLFFRAPELALATLTRIAEIECEPKVANGDPFYTRTDLSLDFYRAIRRVQRDHLASRTYARAVTAFGLGLLKQTGSRVSRRQSDIASDRAMNLRQIRAIPHNAILQQLGYPVNVITGVGTAAESEPEAIAELLADSQRGRQIVRLLAAANELASVKTVAAFGELFNSAYWASRTYRGDERGIEGPCLALAEYLINDDRAGVYRRLASRLRVDWIKLHRLIARLPAAAPPPEREGVRRELGVLQALRLALLQHMFLKAVSVPPFSRSNDISREDVLEMVLSLRIDDALSQLRRAYPVAEPSLSDFSVSEPTDYPTGTDTGYSGIRARLIEPIERAHSLNLRIATAIANHFGAHG